MAADRNPHSPKARKPGARPSWSRLSAAELARERAQVQRKARELRERLAQQERCRQPGDASRREAQLQQLREQVEGMHATAQTLRARCQQR